MCVYNAEDFMNNFILGTTLLCAFTTANYAFAADGTENDQTILDRKEVLKMRQDRQIESERSRPTLRSSEVARKNVVANELLLEKNKNVKSLETEREVSSVSRLREKIASEELAKRLATSADKGKKKQVKSGNKS